MTRIRLMRRARRTAVLGVLLLPLGLGLAGVSSSGAAFSAMTTGTSTLGTDSLNAPGALSAVRTCPSWTAPTFVGSDVRQSGSTSATHFGRPTGTQTGDLLLVFVVAYDNGGFITGPAGWTRLYQHENVSGMRAAGFWRFVAAGEPANHTFSWGTTAAGSATMVVYRGANPADPVDAFSTIDAPSAAAVQLPSVTASVPRTRLVLGIVAKSSAGFSAPASSTVRVTNPTGSVADEVLAASGASGPRTYTLSSPDPVLAVSLAVKGQSTGGDTVAMSWPATSDAYADGYELRRTGSDGSTTTRTITGRLTMGAIDSPASTSRSYTYSLRTAEGAWRSPAVSDAVAAC